MNTCDLISEHIHAKKLKYDEIQESHGIEQLIVFSGSEIFPFLEDIPYPFKVSPQFRELVPIIEASNSWIINTIGSRLKLILHAPENIWSAKKEIPSESWFDSFDVIVITSKEDALKYINQNTSSAFLGAEMPFFKTWPLGNRSHEPLIKELFWNRASKTEYEQHCIKQANNISSLGHVAAKNAFFSGASELEINMEFNSACQLPESKLAYPSVVATNENASILHYGKYDNEILPDCRRRSLLIDAGASFQGYASDITRTYSFKDDVFNDLITELDATQQLIMQRLHKGDTYESFNLSSLYLVAKLLVDFRLVRTTPEAILEQNVLRYFMPHTLGHFMGIQVHDVGGDFMNARGDKFINKNSINLKMGRNIREGHVLTVEPGIYFINSLLDELYASKFKELIDWSLVDLLKPYGGVRIEDNILITSTGVENFTRQSFAHLENKYEYI